MKVSSDAKTPQEAVRDIETLITSAINREKSKLNHCVTKKQEQMVQAGIDTLLGIRYQVTHLEFEDGK